MDSKVIVLAFMSVVILVSAAPRDEKKLVKRDVMETMTNAWNEVVKTLSNAGDAVVQVFKPTEKTIVVKIAETFQPTEKSLLNKMADGISGNH